MASVTDPPFLNVFDPAFDPVGEEATVARETHFYATTPGPPILLRYDDVRGALRDSERWIHGAAGYMAAHGVTEGPTAEWWAGTLMSMGANPPEHKRIRDSVSRAFTPRRVDDLRDKAQELSATVTQDYITPGEVIDFCNYTRRYPALLMCELLGVPPEDFGTFSQGAADIGLAFSRQITPEQLPAIDAAIVHLGEYVTELIDRLRSEPGDDLISALLEHDDLSDEERHNLVMLLIWGGQDTTHCQLGRAIVAFAENPDQWELLAKDPGLAALASEEIVRYTPQARVGWRIATQDLKLDDLDVPAQSMVLLNFAGANRDPRAFDNPEAFDITSKHRSGQLGFSHGMHYCLGANVARMSMAETLTGLAARFEPPEIAGEIEWRAPQASIHGPERLPVQFTAR